MRGELFVFFFELFDGRTLLVGGSQTRNNTQKASVCLFLREEPSRVVVVVVVVVVIRTRARTHTHAASRIT